MRGSAGDGSVSVQLIAVAKESLLPLWTDSMKTAFLAIDGILTAPPIFPP